MTTEPVEPAPLRILAVSALWQGANDYAFVRAFRRAGHSVRVVSEAEFFPHWRSTLLRGLRRALRGRLVREYNARLLAEARQLRPDLVFVFKGAFVKGETLHTIKNLGAICIQYYPDTGFQAHSPYLKEALRQYDWIFSTKPDHPEMLRRTQISNSVSFLPHAFDPETHCPPVLNERDFDQYCCDASFIGNISKKKYETMRSLCQHMPDLDIRIWGRQDWGCRDALTAAAYQGSPVWGLEYAKAIAASRINLGLLFEGIKDGAADVVTARTFEIPGVGGFMLHERTEKAAQFFDEDRDCAFFSGPEELSAKIRHYLGHDEERRAVAAAGRRRCLTSGYSVDDRAQAIIDKFHDLRTASRASVAEPCDLPSRSALNPAGHGTAGGEDG